MTYLKRLLFLAVLWKSGCSESAEIIKLTNGTNIICAAEEITNSAIFINPPLPEVSNSENVLENIRWTDNWTRKSSEESYNEAVLDKRCEDFSLNFTNKMVFLNFTSTTLFIYGAVEVRFLSSDEDYSYNFKIKIDEDNQWTALGFFVKNQNVYIFKSNKLIHTFEKVGNMENLLITTDKETYFKVAKYSFIESTVPSRKTTSLTIPENESTYLILYVSLCSWCKLEISSNEKNATIKSIAEDNDILRKWQTYKLDIDLTEDVTLEFNRSVTGNQTDGYWSLDIKLYRNKHQITTYQYTTNLSPENYKCDFLTKSLNKTLEIVSLKTCKPGELGNTCSITCVEILGKNVLYNYTSCKNISSSITKLIGKITKTDPSIFIAAIVPYILLIIIAIYYLIQKYKQCYSSQKNSWLPMNMKNVRNYEDESAVTSDTPLQEVLTGQR